MIKEILLSRIEKLEATEEVLERRIICRDCEFNSKNAKNIYLIKKVFIYLSDFYSWFMNKEDEDILGNCTSCMSCSIYYKTLWEKSCPEKKWKE